MLSSNVPRNRRSSVIWAGALLSLTGLLWASLPLNVGDASHGAAVPEPQIPAGRISRPLQPDLRAGLAPGRQAALLRQVQAEEQLNTLHNTLWLHARGAQLLTAWNAPVTLKAINWYGFDFAPFVAEGLDRLPLDDILATIRRLGFNAIRLPFADETVESNPVVRTDLAANPSWRGLHSLDILQRLIERAHDFGLRIILVNSRSEGGRGPELKTGLWYTARYPISAWYDDWETLARRLRHDDAFVGADLRNEPHIIGSQFTEQAYFQNGPLWGAYHGTYYHDRDWHYAAETLGNDLLAINPHLLIMVEGVQMYLDPYRNVLTGGLWGGNLEGVQYDPVVLSRPGQLVYSVHEYGPHMWQGDWFNPHTTYAALARRWDHLWAYLLTASRVMQAPIFVGEFGTCHDYRSCVTSSQGWKQGFWFQSFVRYLSLHPQVGWAYWSLNPTGPFHPGDKNFYSLLSSDWQHYYPLIVGGLNPVLREPDGLWNTALPSAYAPSAVPGCVSDQSCTGREITSPSSPQATAPPSVTSVRFVPNVDYAGIHDPRRSGDLYLPQGSSRSTRPALIVMHDVLGAGGTKGGPDTASLAAALAWHGYAVFDINYRLIGQGGAYPRNIRDARAAARFLAANAGRYGINPAWIAAAGSGAGGYLALMAAYAPRTPLFEPRSDAGAPFAAVAALFAPVRLQSALAGPGADVLDAYLGAHANDAAAASPDTYVDMGVPTIMFSGLSDSSYPFHDDFLLYKWLRQRSIHSQLIDLAGAPRSLSALTPTERQTTVLQIARFLDGVFYAPPRKP